MKVISSYLEVYAVKILFDLLYVLGLESQKSYPIHWQIVLSCKIWILILLPWL